VDSSQPRQVTSGSHNTWQQQRADTKAVAAPWMNSRRGCWSLVLLVTVTDCNRIDDSLPRRLLIDDALDGTIRQADAFIDAGLPAGLVHDGMFVLLVGQG